MPESAEVEDHGEAMEAAERDGYRAGELLAHYGASTDHMELIARDLTDLSAVTRRFAEALVQGASDQIDRDA